MTITETVYYSMELPPQQQTALSELESLESGISTFTGNLGDYVCDVLGCTWMGATVTGSGVFRTGSASGASTTTESSSTSAASSASSGAAVQERSLRGWLDFAPMLPVVAGFLG